MKKLIALVLALVCVLGLVGCGKEKSGVIGYVYSDYTGISIIVFSVLSSVTLYTENDIFILVGTAVLIIGIIIGLVISFRAMIKYNKGIF